MEKQNHTSTEVDLQNRA